jgi:hypothetical protein
MWKLGLLALVFSGLIVAACGSGGSSELEAAPLPTAPDDPSALTLSGEGYSFSHPQDWEWAGESSGSLAGASIVSTLLLAPGTEADLPEPELLRVTVSRVPLAIENSQWGSDLSPEERSEYLNEVADVPRRVTADTLEQFAEWRVPNFMLAYDDIREGPFATTVDGLPALYLVAEGTDVQGRSNHRAIGAGSRS